MKLVLFDCDGTLVDSADVIHQCMRLTFTDFTKPEPMPELTRSIIGLTLDTAIARMLGGDITAEVTAMTARYKEHFFAYRAAGGKLEPMFDGMKALIEACAAQEDMVLGVVTGKSRRGLAAILEHHGLTNHFFTLRTADDCPSKPHPAMVLECCAEAGFDAGDAIVIGDAIYDMQMARAAGATAVGVSWGYAPVSELKSAGAHEIADDVAGLAAILGLQTLAA